MSVLLIEDDSAIAGIIQEYLRREGLSVIWCDDGLKGYHTFLDECVQLVIVDLMLPYMDGFTLCSRFRAHSNVPIIVVSAKQGDFDKLHSFDLGVDDYVTKPFSPLELLARVKAQLRRHHHSSNTSMPNFKNEAPLSFADITIDRRGCRVLVNGQPLSFTLKEYELFLYLAENPGKTFTKEALYQHIWHEDSVDIRTVTVHIKNIRHKVSDGKRRPKYIETVWGVGYKFIGHEKK
ncbi:response regulator transcription factor [Shouchella lonarensis]|uniref:DNA-binding response regulator, OmpR family, contains REC and winged-helix (WHTH) domain n=1 Tax=Shouchella lonarensis TaxID=1464122 RepID=A0A1G6IYX9_9BACI|nr:response regulator transcription factor [Shouchella lonarensis]SDC11717.1 DNA-binding response regulator, OmpR family, contains REC and winged-helix (wHTH) domain [Shouchella lonarensis]